MSYAKLRKDLSREVLATFKAQVNIDLEAIVTEGQKSRFERVPYTYKALEYRITTAVDTTRLILSGILDDIENDMLEYIHDETIRALRPELSFKE